MVADSSQDDLAYIKNFITDLLGTYLLPVTLNMGWKSSQLPWGNMARELALLGLVLINWDPLVLLPGDPSHGHSKGISDLSKEQRGIFRNRCDHPTHPLKLKYVPSQQTGKLQYLLVILLTYIVL